MGTLDSVSPGLRLQLRRWLETWDNRWNQWVLGYGRQQQFQLLRDWGWPEVDAAALARLLVLCLSGLGLAGAAWAWWDGRRQAPWPRLQRRLARRLARWGVVLAPADSPAALARRLAERHGQAVAPWWKPCRPCSASATPRPRRGHSPPGGGPSGPRSGAALPAAPIISGMTLSLPAAAARLPRPAPARSGRPGLHRPGRGALGQARPVKAAAVISDDSPDVVIYGQREDVVQFGRALAAANQLDPDWVVAQLAQARFQPRVTQLVMPPPVGTAKNWAAYRARFVEPQRIGAGLRWWQDNAQALSRAEARYGVPPEIVAAIVGVETFYGRLTGSFKVIDALATLSFDFPSGRSDRSAFYRDELGAFLRWCAAEKRDPQSVLGSFAGAIGLPQFMPSSILKYAVDFDGDGRIDLNTHGDDVVGSVAHYLAEFGWQRGLVPTVAVTPPRTCGRRR
jgi:lytic murein transglycosylase B